MSITFTKTNVVNYLNPIFTYEKPLDKIRAEINQYFTTENIGKYLLFRDDSGEAQTTKYTVYKILCESKEDPPLFSIKEIGLMEVDIPDIGQGIVRHTGRDRGGKTKKKRRRIRKKNKRRTRSKK